MTESELGQALERDELLLHYQPKVELNTGQVVAVEALLRWQHPTLGMLLPAQFIPLAEKTGLIIPMGEWVLRTACTQNKAWQDQGLPPVRVTVNMSSREFEQPGLSHAIQDVLKQTGLKSECLGLELTESTTMTDAGSAVATMHKLHIIGVQLAIDNLGTGHSSLSYLKRLPVNVIQVDGSFVRDVVADVDSAVIVRGMIAIAHGLRLGIVAKCVETKDQLAFLRACGCDMMQGFLFSKPLPPNELADLQRNGRSLRAA